MESSKKDPVFIETEELQNLIDKPPTSGLKILDCTVHSTPEEGDAILTHKKCHIPG